MQGEIIEEAFKRHKGPSYNKVSGRKKLSCNTILFFLRNQHDTLGVGLRGQSETWPSASDYATTARSQKAQVFILFSPHRKLPLLMKTALLEFAFQAYMVMRQPL